ncbi:energy-coupling factor ABC transporter ATP-binding protein [Vibrio sp. JC009]|uniref:energy-coupling factor ABC transporter ATP-binding protein n=1 Tax=Vibrio sp. JC009 TaxID=2912314 RepID=UPI0023AFE077|nr:energy-coupling factor ABC transporter ATP-binding protein [Vibrio sp. JC009]WED24663.1 energy-coupling factor ABC transporter ATP-binding protein [Vibrio sp. JC009]
MKNLIELKDVTFLRPNGQQCADALSFSLSESDKVAITGSNGSGKSTLLQIILGLLDGAKGEIKLFGKVCESEEDFAVFRPKIGYLFQDPDDQLFCPTVLEDVCFGPVNMGHSQREAEKMAIDTLEQLGIGHLADRVSYHLSGGQKRLVSLATVLVMEPELLLLDEPTNGLDDHNYQLFIDIVTQTKLPVILVSHDVALRNALTDVEYRLTDGKLIRQHQ